MKKHSSRERKSSAPREERAARCQDAGNTYVLRLFIAGSTPRAKAAVMRVKSFCEKHLKDHYELDVIDIYQQPFFARDEQVIAAPTLIKKSPEPSRRLVGDFSKTDRVKSVLGIAPQAG